MKNINFKDFQEAVKIFGLIGLENKSAIKDKYLNLLKQFHPDMQNGDTEKFQKMSDAYKILMAYVDNFKFKFTQEEFKSQYPFGGSDDEKWSLW